MSASRLSRKIRHPGLRTVGPSAAPKSLFGYMKDTMRIKGDVVAPTGELWSAVSGAEDHFYGTVRMKRTARPKSV